MLKSKKYFNRLSSTTLIINFPLRLLIQLMALLFFIELGYAKINHMDYHHFNLLQIQTNIEVENLTRETKVAIKRTDPTLKFRENRDVKLHFSLPDCGLILNLTFMPKKEYIKIVGKILSIKKEDTAVNIKLGFKVDPYKSRLWQSLASYTKYRWLFDASEVRLNYPIMAFDCLSNEGFGITIAQPPKKQLVAYSGINKEGVYLKLSFGLSESTELSYQTGFVLLLYTHDPVYGIRSSLQKYYQLFPYTFKSRVAKYGAWYTSPISNQKSGPKYKAYHQAGRAQFDLVRMKPLAKSVSDYTKLCGLKDDLKLQNYFFPYVIIGQRQIFGVPYPLADYEEAMKILSTWKSPKPIPFDSSATATRFESDEILKNIIYNCGLYNQKNMYVFKSRTAYGRGLLTFPLNPAPKLYEDDFKDTIAKDTFKYIRTFLDQEPEISGIYIDSIAKWSQFYNYRKTHFKYSSSPLTYDPDSNKPAINNLFSIAEFLWALRDKAIMKGKLLFGNGIKLDTAPCAMALDILGTEISKLNEKKEDYHTYRMMAGQKPFVILNDKNNNKVDFWEKALFYGFILSARSAKLEKMFMKYAPVMIRLNELGWEPMTYAKSNDKDILIERWGPGSFDKAVCFTLLNASGRKKTVRIQLNIVKIGLNPKKYSFLYDMISNNKISANTGSKRIIQATLNLSAGESRALELR